MRTDLNEAPPRGMTAGQFAVWTRLEALAAGVRERRWEEGELMVAKIRQAFRETVES